MIIDSAGHKASVRDSLVYLAARVEASELGPDWLAMLDGAPEERAVLRDMALELGLRSIVRAIDRGLIGR